MRRLLLQFIAVLFTSSLALGQTVGPTPFGQLNIGFTQPNYEANINGTPSQLQNYNTSVSITSATPGVVSWSGNLPAVGAQVVFQTLGSITGLSTYTTYYVSSAGYTLNSFQLSTTYANALAGTSITTGGTTSTGLIAYTPQGLPPGPTNFLTLDQSGALNTDYDGYSVLGTSDIITAGLGITSASPGVVTWANFPFKIGDPVIFTNVGTVTAISTNTTYYVSATGYTAGVSFEISTTLANALAGTSINTTGTTSASGVSGLQPVIFTQDMTGYSGINIAVTSAGTSITVQYEVSEDTLTWYNTTGRTISATQTVSPVNNSASVTAITFPRTLRYFRTRVSAYTSGTLTLSYDLTKTPPQLFTGAVNLSTLSSGVEWTTTLQPTSSVAVAQAGWTYSHTATAAATTIKSGAGYLHTVCLNSPSGTGTLTVADATSGTTPAIAIITASGAAAVAGQPFCQTYDVLFATGLTITDATEAQDVTVSYK